MEKVHLLSILAGLDRSFIGELLVDDKPVSSSNGDRIVIFQENSLFPWLNVIQNIEFGLRQVKVSKNLRKSIAMNYLNMVGLSDFAYTNIHESFWRNETENIYCKGTFT